MAGVTPASNEEIYLYYIIAQVANADNWGMEHDLIAPIGSPAKPGGAVPVGKAPSSSIKAGERPPNCSAGRSDRRPKGRAAAITALKTTHGITKVTMIAPKGRPTNKVVAACARGGRDRAAPEESS